MRLHVIFSKALRDFSSVKRNLIYLAVILLVPFIASGALGAASDFGMNFTQMTLAMQNQYVTGVFILIVFLWTAGLPLVMLSANTCGGFVANEEESGTLLLLVSKPVRRWEILLGKFSAFFLNAALLTLFALIASPLLMHSMLGTDIFVFETMMSLVPYLFMYSLLIIFVFGALSTVLSMVMKSSMRTLIVVAAIAIFIFFGVSMVRGMLTPMYEPFKLYTVDLNYHLGNAYQPFVEASGYRMMPVFQGIVGGFTGTYSSSSINEIFDNDLGAMPPSLKANDYFSPVLSILELIAMGAVFFVVANLWFEKREIQH